MTAPGLCECGCGQETSIARRTRSNIGVVKGQPRRFLAGHNKKNGKPEHAEEDRGHGTPCWIWQRALNQEGYGHAWNGEKVVRAHRMVYERHRGPIPSGADLDHLCRVRACVNPDHLEPVPHAINNRRGAGTKLKEWQVAAMRRAREEAELTDAQLAAAFGVSKSQVRVILAGKQWKAEGYRVEVAS